MTKPSHLPAPSTHATAWLALLFLAWPIAARAQFTYTTNNGAITITGYTGSGGDVTIPSVINGRPVTSIGEAAFWHNYSLTGLTIPNGVANIGDSAFKDCIGLAHVTIPNSITNIGDYVFSDTGLITLTIPSSVISIGDEAFADCEALSSVTIPYGVTSIGSYAFSDCSSLKVVTIPDSVTNVESYAFFNCFSLRAATIPNSISSIEDWTFAATALTSVTIPSSVTRIGDGAFQECPFRKVTVPGTVASIGAEAFSFCQSLTKLTISNGVANIGDRAFEDCGVTNVTIPDSVTNIGDSVFDDCFELSAINVSAANLFYASANGVLFNKNQTTLLQYPYGNAPVSYAIPNGVTNIGTNAFYGCGLTNVTIPDSVTALGDGAFAYCYSLASVTIGHGVTSIGNNAFYGCGLTNVVIPDGVTNIGGGAFAYCYSLASVTIGPGVTSIGNSAFFDCDLTNVTIPDGVTNIGDFAFNDCSSLGAIHVDVANLFYADINGVLLNKSQTTLIQYPNGIASTSYAIPNGVTNVGTDAFADCANLVNVTIPDSVATIEDSAFPRCINLTTVTMGNGVTNIGDVAFENCYQLADIFIFANAPTVGPRAFAVIHHTVEGDFPFPDNATVYYLASATGWSNTFAGLPAVGLDQPAQFGTTAEGWNYLSDQVKITVITGYAGSNGVAVIPSLINGLPVTGIGGRAFANTAIVSVTIPESVTSIGSAAFEGCTNLTSVIIPDSVTGIGEDAFADCNELTNVFSSGNAPTADWSVFGYDSVTVYYLPGATGWDDFSAEIYIPVALWLPQAQTRAASFGVPSNQFGFDINWASGQTVVVEACTNLSSPVWISVGSNILVGGTSYFSDPQPASLPGRFYRLRSP